MTREQAIVEIERLQEVLREICKEADLCLKTQGSTAKGNGARYGYGKIRNLADNNSKGAQGALDI